MPVAAGSHHATRTELVAARSSCPRCGGGTQCRAAFARSRLSRQKDGNAAGNARAKAILKSLAPAQRALICDPAWHVSGLCPRRAGKSYAGSAAALITGEAKPGSVSVIISLNLKQLKRIYWSGGASGLFTFDKKFGLNLEFNKTECRWEHENGSIGYLLGTADAEQLEVIRGLEADLYLVDECKSFAPSVLETLIDDVIDPQRATRRGRLILIGTPGNIASGPFYQATNPDARDADGRPYTIFPSTTDEWGRTANADMLWSAHAWTLEDNTAAPHQWTDALTKKRAKQWSDDDPKWRREYLGKWTNSTEGSVSRYYDEKRSGPPGWVNWVPKRDEKNPTGLPPELGPWHILGGLDLGFNDATALVVAAYSQKARELRHVHDWNTAHLLPDDVAELLRESQRKFGKFERVYADTANGKMVVEFLKNQGFPMEKAEKREKNDHIELQNSAFHRGEIKIIEDTVLEHQLITNQWALGDRTLEELARLGRLVEDKSIPNDSFDAFLYLFRGAMHRFGPQAGEAPPEYLSPEWTRTWEKDQLRAARASLRSTPFDKALRGEHSAPTALRNALSKKPWHQQS